MRVLQKEMLKSYIEMSLQNISTERFLLKMLHNYMTSENDRKVCCLYGLRRTGKTIMTLQEAKNLNDYGNTLFVRCDNGDTTWDLRKTIDGELARNPNTKYIFIDEATKAKQFINTCSFLADDYAMMGIKVVLAGTDSLGFFIAENRELYDRAHILHTTYIPFKEYNAILGKNIDDYISYGGTLTDGENNVFYNNDLANKYTNSAIIENIFNTVKSWNRGENQSYYLLRDVIENNEFPSIVNKVIQQHNHRFLKEIINDEFGGNDLGSLADMVFKHNLGDSTILETDLMKDRMRVALGIKENLFKQIDNDIVNVIIESLKNLDVLYPLPNIQSINPIIKKEYAFTQVGMRYCQVKSQIFALETSEDFKKNYSPLQQAAIVKKLDEDVRGGILEDIIFCQLAKEFEMLGQQNYLKISKYHTQSAEFDVVVLDYVNKSAFAIEVKHSSEKVPNQYNHLINPTVCSDFETKSETTIANKAVIYLGDNSETNDGVLYINAEDFLSRSQEMLKVLLTHRDIKTFNQLEELIKQGSVGNGDDEQKAKPQKKKSKFDIDR